MHKAFYTYGFGTVDGYDTQLCELGTFPTRQQALACVAKSIVELKHEHNSVTWLVNAYFTSPDSNAEYLYRCNGG